MTAALIVSAVCLGRWSGSWARQEQERMISWKRILFRSLSFVVLLLVFGVGANNDTKTESESSVATLFKLEEKALVRSSATTSSIS